MKMKHVFYIQIQMTHEQRIELTTHVVVVLIPLLIFYTRANTVKMIVANEWLSLN